MPGMPTTPLQKIRVIEILTKMERSIFRLFFNVLLIGFFIIPLFAAAQDPQTEGKLLKTTGKLNQGVQKMNEKSATASQHLQQTGDGVKSTVENVKAVIRVFEPIVRFRLKRKKTESSGTEGAPAPEPPSTEGNASAMIPGAAGSPVPADDLSYNSIETGMQTVTESPLYNADGTANLGNQNNSKFGCYLDFTQGRVMDEIDAAGNSSGVDLIFTATDYYGSAPMYALLTPAYVKNDFFSNYYFRGPLFKDANIPVKQWDEVNESEVALTQLTGSQFDKIQDNNQLMAVIKRISGFKEKFESRTKINEKVFAVKTEMGNRTAYGLMYVTNHYGTTGTNGYLTVKLKVTGFDSNGDGYPDSNMY